MMKGNRIYSKKQISMILRHIPKRDPIGIRNRAIVYLLFSSGLKIKEALNIMPNDIEITEAGLNIIVSKRYTWSRVVPILYPWMLTDEMKAEELEAKDMIMEWIEERKLLGYDNSQRLFCTLKKGKQMSSDYMRGFFSRLSKKIEKATGNKIRIHSQKFRLTRAKFLFDTGYGIEHIQDQLGYDSDCWFLQNMIQHM